MRGRANETRPTKQRGSRKIRKGERLGKAIKQRREIIRISGLNSVVREGLTKKLKKNGILHSIPQYTRCDKCQLLIVFKEVFRFW